MRTLGAHLSVISSIVVVAASLLPATEESSGAVWEAPDFLYLLPSSEEGDRSITLDTCVEGVAAWDTFLYVIPVQDGTYPCIPYLLDNLPAAGVTVFNISQTTCDRDAAYNWDCQPSLDFLYLLPSSEEDNRSITLDTCVEGVAAWNTVLYVIPVQDGTCGQCSGVIAFNDDGSTCGGGRSRVTFNAAAGQAYWVLVDGSYDSTCNEDNRWNCKAAPDFLYLLPSSKEGDRSITLDTCSEEMATWDSILYVIPTKDGTCGQCSGVIAANDDGSICGGGLSRVTFTAKAGQAYWVLVEGYSFFDTRASTCGRANGWNCRPAPDFLYLLPSSEEGDRSITLDTCVDGVAAWDTILYVIPTKDGTCGQCSGVIAINDNRSICGNGLSRVTFTARAGQAYWVLVEGYSASNCGELALTVTTSKLV
ncbi:hypothetical protein HaLaN_10886 [Haematococcus lacustris]|uniref:Uncharacterized protein n=1 Tax=Haematococcus lacustris TaxID=44745 RepID=A0A699ZGP3_HAELA|nr:hypothetical protein HaLaN_10886 [Haematococcus lacustris]